MEKHRTLIKTDVAFDSAKLISNGNGIAFMQARGPCSSMAAHASENSGHR